MTRAVYVEMLIEEIKIAIRTETKALGKAPPWAHNIKRILIKLSVDI